MLITSVNIKIVFILHALIPRWILIRCTLDLCYHREFGKRSSIILHVLPALIKPGTEAGTWPVATKSCRQTEFCAGAYEYPLVEKWSCIRGLSPKITRDSVCWSSHTWILHVSIK